jgi:virginiamycin B lyase
VTKRLGIALAALALALVAPATASAATLTTFSTAGTTRHVAVGPDGNLWFTEQQDRVGRVTTGGVLDEFVVGTGAAPKGIAAGPDGKLWFTEPGVDKIGTIAANGTGLVEYGTGIAVGADPDHIAAGSDGRLWFTQPGVNAIGAITTAGVVTSYPIPTAASEPTGIAAGPDGALWFTERLAAKVGRITTAGAVTEFPVTGGKPGGIVTGSDGNLWFAVDRSGLSPATPRIGRMTPAGAVTELPLRFNAQQPVELATAPGGDLVVTQAAGASSGGSLTRMSTAGSAGEYTFQVTPVDQQRDPVGIVMGPDGNLWITGGASNVGRLTAGTAPLATTSGASAVTQTGATLNGKVTPGGSRPGWVFEHGTSTSYGSITPLTVINAADGVERDVSRSLTGLTPGATYHFRTVATTIDGTDRGADEQFTTSSAPVTPIVDEDLYATEITAHGAKLGGRVTPNGAATDIHFEYGPTDGYGSSTSTATSGTGSAPVPITANVSGLPAWSTVHWRIVATNSAGTTFGPDRVVRTYTDLPAGTPGTPVASFAGGLATVPFGASTDGRFTALARQADGRLVAAGQADGDLIVARFNTNGSLDTGFDGDGKVQLDFAGGNDAAAGVALQDDKILVAGNDTSGGALVRLDSAGALDTGFPGGGKLRLPHSVLGLAVQADRKVVLAGSDALGVQTAIAVTRLTEAGTPDAGFGAAGERQLQVPGQTFSRAMDVALDSAGRIVLAVRAGSSYAAARLLAADGAPDPAFDADGIQTLSLTGEPSSVAIAGGDAVLLAGDTFQGNGMKLVKLTSAGTLDGTFGAGGLVTTSVPDAPRSFLLAAITQPDGRVLTAGWATLNGRDHGLLARFTATGAPDTDFGAAGMNVLPGLTDLAAILPPADILTRADTPQGAPAGGAAKQQDAQTPPTGGGVTTVSTGTRTTTEQPPPPPPPTPKEPVDVAIMKLAGAARLGRAGFQLWLLNHSNSTVRVRVTDATPPGFKLSGAGGFIKVRANGPDSEKDRNFPCSVTGNTVECEVDLPPSRDEFGPFRRDRVMGVEVWGTWEELGPHQNTATVTLLTGTDPNLANNTSTVAVDVERPYSAFAAGVPFGGGKNEAKGKATACDSEDTCKEARPLLPCTVESAQCTALLECSPGTASCGPVQSCTTDPPPCLPQDACATVGPQLCETAPRAGASAVKLKVKRVQVAVLRLAKGAKAAAKSSCPWLANARGRFKAMPLVAGRCRVPVWLTAKGTKNWRLKLRRRLPKGSYVAYSRTTSSTGVAEGTYSVSNGNLRRFKVR